MLFDTLELSKALQASFTPEQAETLVQALGRATSEQVTTKADIAEVKAEIAEVKGEIAELRGEIAAVRSELRAEIATLESRLTSQISLLRADTIKWIVSAIGFNFLATAGLIITLTKVFAH